MLILAIITCLLIPANLTWTATALMFAVPVRRLNWEWHHTFFMFWMMWAAMGCFLSPHAEMAIYGHGLRMEGLLTWIVLARMAWLVWETWDTWIMPVVVLLFMIVFIAVCNTPLPGKLASLVDFRMTPITMGNFAAMLAVILWTYHPMAVLFVLPFLIMSDGRGAWIGAVAGIVVYALVSWKITLRKGILTALVTLFVIGISVATTPLGKKLSRIDVTNLGSGARSQWALQAWDKAKERPLLGHGLDTLSMVLKPVESKYSKPKNQVTISDRTHNLALDILLQTGWIGLTLGGLAIGGAVGMAIKHQSPVNRQCLAVLTCWLTLSMFNPSGIPALFMALAALFGVGKKEDS